MSSLSLRRGPGRGSFFPIPSSQIQRGISLIILPLPSERAGERLLFPHSALSSTMGYLANCSPSPFGEGRGEAVRGCVSGFFGDMFRLFEILLQTVRCYCSQINSLSLKTAFVTYRESVSYKEACKRCPFALQNMPFYTSKDALLHCKRACFRRQKGVDGKEGRKDVDKNNPRNTASPSPSEGGDVPGGIRNAGSWGYKRKKN